MSQRVYSEINLHITWHTKNSLALIGESTEHYLHKYLKSKIVETPGTHFHAIGGMENHIHLGLTVKPSVHLDEWIGQLKGASSHEFGKALQWQAGY
jgi:putative transposase